MSKYIATEDCEVEVNGGTVTGVFSIDTDPKEDVLINNSKCYFGDITVTVKSGARGPAGTLTGDVAITVKATGDDVTVNDNNALLDGDKSDGTDNGVFQPDNPLSPPVNVPLTVVIKDAGQTDVTIE